MSWQERLWEQKHLSLALQGQPEGPRSSGESSAGRREWPLTWSQTRALSVLQEASKKHFKRFSQTGQWRAGDFTRPFHTILPQSDIHCLVSRMGPILSCPPPEEAWGPQPSLCHPPSPHSSHVLAHVCAHVCCCVVNCPSPSPNAVTHPAVCAMTTPSRVSSLTPCFSKMPQESTKQPLVCSRVSFCLFCFGLGLFFFCLGICKTNKTAAALALDCVCLSRDVFIQMNIKLFFFWLIVFPLPSPPHPSKPLLQP